MDEDFRNLLNKCSLIKDANSIAILAHYHPDGDAVGSAAGLYHLIKENFGKEPTIIYDGQFQGNLDFLLEGIPTAKRASEMNPNEKFDLVIVVDTAEKRLLAGALPFFESAKHTIKIDHHIIVESYAEWNIESNLPANTMQIFNIARELNWKINQDAATALYVGIYTDTGKFSHSDGSEVIHAAAALVDLGVDYRKVANILAEDTMDAVMANARIVESAEFMLDGALAIAEVNFEGYKNLGGDKGSPAMRKLRSIRGVRVVILLREEGQDNVRVSMRAKDVEIREFAVKMGGGGHKFAAAFRLHTSLPEARKIVVEEFKKFYNSVNG